MLWSALQPMHASHAQELVRVGLVGCGRIAEFGYAPAFKEADGVMLAGVADVNLFRCKKIAPGLPAFESTRALIRAGGVDALVISTPTRFHLPDARCGAEAGLPTLIEKPPGLTSEEANALQALKPTPWIAFNRRFEPAVCKLKDALRRGGRFCLNLKLHYRRRAWRSFDMQDDVLLDLGPHLIDLARWLTGSEIVEVRAICLRAHRVRFELLLEQGQASISCSNARPHYERIEVKDSSGNSIGKYERGGVVSGVLAKFQPNRPNPLVCSLVRQLEAFGGAVRGVRPATPLATPADGMAVMSVIDAVRRSAVQGGIACSLPVVREGIDRIS